MKKIPNILTVFRILLIPVFIYFYSYSDNSVAAAFTFLVAGITDVLDGYIARKFDAQTSFGALFDPLADKLLQLTATLCIALAGTHYMWILFWILLIRELAMVTGATRLYTGRRVVVPAAWYGKVSSLLLFAVLFFIIYLGPRIPDNVCLWLVISAIAVMMLAGVGYLINYIKTFSKKEEG